MIVGSGNVGFGTAVRVGAGDGEGVEVTVGSGRSVRVGLGDGLADALGEGDGEPAGRNARTAPTVIAAATPRTRESARTLPQNVGRRRRIRP